MTTDDDKKTEEPAKRRWGKMRGLGAIVPSVTKTALDKRGFVQGEVIGRWREIIGERLAASTSPEKLTFPRGERSGATLYVRVSPGLAVEIQHDQPRILQRINAYFGYSAVARLKLVQAPVPPRPRGVQPRPRTLADSEINSIRKEVAGTQDPDLRAALEQFGRSVNAAPPKKRK
jgi:hypothetical protein